MAYEPGTWERAIRAQCRCKREVARARARVRARKELSTCCKHHAHLGARRERQAASAVAPASDTWERARMRLKRERLEERTDDVRVARKAPPESVRRRSANSISKLLRDHRCLLVRNRLYACFGDAQQVGCVAAPSELAVTDLITPVALQNLFTHSLPCGATPLRRRPWPAL